MTTTNNHLTLIDQVGGIEKAKEIVETHPFCYMPHTFKYWSKELDDYVLSTKYATVLVDDLHTAIENHYYGRSEAEELAAYTELSQEKIKGGAMLVGDFSEARKIIDKQLESDHVTDIRNHISPNTKVVEL